MRRLYRSVRILFVTLSLFGLAVPATAQFVSVRIGDVDGFGFREGDDDCSQSNAGAPQCWRALPGPVPGGCQPPSTTPAAPRCTTSVNGDGLWMLGDGDYLPDLDCTGCVGSSDCSAAPAGTGSGGDCFDNRAGESVLCSGCTSLLAPGVAGEGQTDRSLIDGDLDPVFEFDFDVANGDILPGAPLYFSLVFADYDNGTATIDVTPGDSTTPITVPLVLQGNQNDGLIQGAFAVLDFDDVFPAGLANGVYNGDLTVEVNTPGEFYVAVDYVEIGVTSRFDCNGNLILDATEIADGTEVDANGDGVLDECQCTRVAVSQESSPGVGDFDDNFLGCIDVFPTSGTAAAYYGYDTVAPESFNGPAPLLAQDRSHLFLVAGVDGLSVVVVHDDTTPSLGGNADMIFNVTGDDGVIRTLEDDPANVGTDTFVPSPSIAPAVLHAASNQWIATRTDGLVLTGLDGRDWTMTVEFDAAAPPQGLTSWAAYSADGTEIGLTLTPGRRVRLGCCGTCTAPPPGLVGWWPLDDNPTLAPTVPDIGGPNHGVEVGPLGNDAERVDGSFLFDGSASYVFVADPDDERLDFGASSSGTTDGDFSIDAWIRTTETSDLRVIVEKAEGCTDIPAARSVCIVRGYSFYLQGDRLGLALGDGNFVAPDQFLSEPIPDLDDGGWHFVAVTVDRDAVNGVRFYFDAASVNPASPLTPTARPNSLANDAPLLIGRGRQFVGSAGGQLFDGNIDEVEIFDRALTAAQIATLFRDGKCKATCAVSSSATCCGGEAEVVITVCADATTDRILDWSPLGFCPIDTDGVQLGSPLSIWPDPSDPVYDAVVVPRGSCVEVPVPIDCDGLTPGGTIPYAIEVSDPAGNVGEIHSSLCRDCGALRVPVGPPLGPVCVRRASVASMGAVGIPGEIVTFPFELVNEGSTNHVTEFEVAADPNDPAAAEVISVQGLPPGTPLEGRINMLAGGTFVAEIDASFTEHDPGYVHEIVLSLDLDGDGDFEPAAVASFLSLPAPTAGGATTGSVPATMTVERQGNGELRFDWSDSCASSEEFAIYEGTIGSGFTDHLPLTCDTGGATTATLPPGAGDRYYLIVPATLLGWEGSYGLDSDGIERVGSTSACRLAEPLSCPIGP